MSVEIKETSAEAQRPKRKIRVAEVVKDKMMKTVVVRVSRRVRHPLYHRIINRHNSFKAHDEKNEARVGDLVKVMETRPLSKDKRWRVVEIVRRAPEAAKH